MPSTDLAADNLSPDMHFKSVDAIFATIENAHYAGQDSLVVAPTTYKQYNALCRRRDARDRRFRLFYLGTQTQILIITITTYAHEIMHLRLTSEVSSQIAQMGLSWSCSSSGSATHSGPFSSHGEADGNLMPSPERVGANLWPTVVFEVGYSQSEKSLRTKMKWWFQASNHDVKMTVLARAFPQTAEKRLKIELWQEILPETVRPGATTTRSSKLAEASLRPACIQTINITWAGPVPFDEASRAQVLDKSQYSVVGAPLLLDFEDVFLRPAVGPHEHDFVLSEDFLEFYAEAVWSSTR